jgi:RNA-binding protein
MKEIILERDARLELRAQAHHLDPVVLLGANGLTEAVLKEIDRALTAHELIKVRVPAMDAEERSAMYAEIAEKLGAARVQTIGRLFIFWRPAEEEDREHPEKALRAMLAAKKAAAAPAPERPTSKKKVARKKPGDKKVKAAPVPRRARPKRKRVTKKAMGARS